jgi:lipopolysaccharide biosynthesis regulator YciM
MKSIRSYPILRGVFGQAEPEDAPYECGECGTRLSVRFQECPECGGYTIDRADWIAGE